MTAALDPRRWAGLWSRLGAEGDPDSVFRELARTYAEPQRAYHGTSHILDCLAQFDLARHLAQRPDEIEAAIWFHDAVYVPAAGDNEERSAQLARQVLARAALGQAACERIAGLILATAHRAPARDPDAMLLADVDLSILGREPAVFDGYERAIRSEYAWVPEDTYRRRRGELLAGFLRREWIYQTRLFREGYETGARRNIERALAQLGRE